MTNGEALNPASNQKPLDPHWRSISRSAETYRQDHYPEHGLRPRAKPNLASTYHPDYISAAYVFGFALVPGLMLLRRHHKWILNH